MALMHHRQMTEDDEDVDIREVQTAKVRRQGTDENWSAIVSITEAIRQAGLEDGGSFRFDPAAIEELGMVPALGSDETVDGRTQPLTRNIKREGKRESPSLRLVLPDEVLEALGITDDEIGGDDPVEVTVWAGESLLGFERSEERTVAIDREDSASR